MRLQYNKYSKGSLSIEIVWAVVVAFAISTRGTDDVRRVAMLRVHVVGREVMSLLGVCRVTPSVDAATKKSMTAFERVSAAALPRMTAKRDHPELDPRR